MKFFLVTSIDPESFILQVNEALQNSWKISSFATVQVTKPGHTDFKCAQYSCYMIRD